MLSILSEHGVILIDIHNNNILPKDYYKESNTMREIFTKKSLEIAIKKAGGDLLFINTNCVKDPASQFHNMIKTVEKNVVSKFFRKITNKLGVSLVPQMDVMKYFSQASEFKYGHPEGQYIRAVVTKSHQ